MALIIPDTGLNVRRHQNTPLLERLNDELGFFIGQVLHRQILDQAGE